MPSPLIEQLLALQECDTRLGRLRQSLARLPLEIAGYEEKIAAERAELEKEQADFKALEVRRKDIDMQLKSSEEQIAKYKTQQLSVKKNEEYQALEHEIATATTEVGTLEDHELEVLMEIDEAREALAVRETSTAEAVRDLEAHIARLREKEAECHAEIDAAEADYNTAKEATDKKALGVYEVVKSGRKKPPYVAAVEGHTCEGCHLRVSEEVVTAARSDDQVVQCSSCGRVVYFP